MAAPPRRRHGGGRMAHLGAREDAQGLQIGRGGLGMLAGEVWLAGVGWSVGVELLVASVATEQLRRAPDDGPVQDTARA